MIKKIRKVVKEGYSDGTVSTQEIMDAISSLEELVEMMDDQGIGYISARPSTYGLGQYFIGFPGGFIDYHNIYDYVGGDDEYDDEYESLKESQVIMGIKEDGSRVYLGDDNDWHEDKSDAKVFDDPSKARSQWMKVTKNGNTKYINKTLGMKRVFVPNL